MAEQAKTLPTPSVEEMNNAMELVNIEKPAEARMKKVEKVSEAEASSKEHGSYKTRDMKSK